MPFDFAGLLYLLKTKFKIKSDTHKYEDLSNLSSN